MADGKTESDLGDPGGPSAGQDLRLVFGVFIGVALFGLLGASMYVAASGNWWVAGFGSAVLIFGAHAMVGGIIGFLFAIPRSRQQDASVAGSGELRAAERDSTKEPGRKRVSDYSANTNLEQISDWLTKILVGASLVQIRTIWESASGLAALLAPALGGATARPVALCLMGFSACWGFFFVYLFTRLWLPKALGRAERDEEVQKRKIEEDVELPNLERRTLNYLYEPPPEGYQRAIDAIENYYGKSGAVRSGALWMYLACAYGQKHAFEKPERHSPPDSDIRERVRAAVEQAIYANPSSKDLLARLYQGTDPSEDDLKTLKPDPTLDELLK